MVEEIQIAEGYKQTEVGVIPEDWVVESLHSITIDMLQGVNTAIDIPEYVDSGIPMLKANDIIDGNIDFGNVDQISLKTFQGYNNRFKPKKGDFLFSNIGARLGTGALLRIDINCSFAWNVMRIIPNLDKVESNYLGSAINSPAFFNSVLANQMGSGMGFVPKNVIKNLQIPLPPTRTEQTAIATALSDMDSLIEGLEKLIAKKRNIKQGAMQELLTPKEGWVEKELGKVAHFENGKAHEQFIDELGNFIVVNSKFISTEGRVKKFSNKNIFPLKKGDITIVMSDIPNGKALAKCFLIDKENKYTLNQRIGGITANEDFDNKYLFYKLNRNKYYLAFDSGTGQTNIKRQEILDCPIFFPPTKKEQTAIATAISDMDTEITELETKLSKYKMLKTGMMQQLLTGKKRLI